uniref:Putative F-box protein n=1 Tax=Noccaea caerulescens TaxID=107243 RepID=A0A1J3JAA1_NOCCA
MAIPSLSFSHYSGSCTSVHGFLAVEATCRLSICNPCTEQFIKFPRGTRYVGYDPIGDQFKALSVRKVDEFRNGIHTSPREHKVLTLGGGGGWRHIEPPTTTPYTIISAGVPINGFVYYGAYSPTPPTNPGIVCFDVRSEKLSYIKAPPIVVFYCSDSIFIEYKGKLASIVSENPYGPFQRFDMWVLEDVQKHVWSNHICVIPLSVWDFVGCSQMSFPGTNTAGELIMAPTMLSHDVQPFYIFYYNVETKNITRVRLLGIGDNQEFRRSYGFIDESECHVRISPQHIESIAFFKNPST